MEDKKLSPEQYYKWRNTISEMWLEESKLKEDGLRVIVMEKDAELSRLRTALYKSQTLNAQREKVSLARSEYERCKKELENQLGISLSGCVIDDVTFEVKMLEEEKEKRGE
jgi:predicted metal-binding transcription factor (methanogenesis marker protein 9)